MPEIQEPLRYVGRPFAEVQAELETAGLPYQTEITRPTRDYFKTDERCLYVVRERKLLDGTLALALAARLQASSPELSF